MRLVLDRIDPGYYRTRDQRHGIARITAEGEGPRGGTRHWWELTHETGTNSFLLRRQTQRYTSLHAARVALAYERRGEPAT